MKIEWKKLDGLKVDGKFLLSFPLRPETYAGLKEQMFQYSILVVNGGGAIVFGIDYYEYLKGKGIDETEVVCMDLSDKEALFLNFNLKEKFTGLNLYEKLVFIKKIMPLAEKKEIYRKTELDININPQLEKNLDMLLGEEFKSVLLEEQITLKAAHGLCGFKPEDRAALLGLFAKIAFSSSHQLRILEITEEILFRDKCALVEVFETLAMGEIMAEEKPQRKIIDALFKHRNPVYWEYEKKWQEELKKLALPANMQVTHYPFFEKRQIELTVRVESLEELKGVVERIGTGELKGDD